MPSLPHRNIHCVNKARISIASEPSVPKHVPYHERKSNQVYKEVSLRGSGGLGHWELSTEYRDGLSDTRPIRERRPKSGWSIGHGSRVEGTIWALVPSINVYRN